MPVKSLCRICKQRCGILVDVAEERLVGVEGDKDNPRSAGYLCPKGRALPEILNSPDRLKYPLKRKGETFERISWDDAYKEIAAGLKNIKEKYGPESLAILTGEASLNEDLRQYFRLFGDLYGTPNWSSGGLCHLVKVLSNKAVYGTLPTPDYKNAACIVIWGTNLDTAEPLNAIKVRAAVKKGAKLIVVDPALTPMARKADVHLRVRPGTDGALALAMMNVIISEGLYDGEFVNKWTVGFDELAQLAARYPPEKAAEITWVPADLITTAARLYAGTRPGCLAYANSTEHHSNAGQSMRAIAMLQALTGNIDVPGGGVIGQPVKLAPFAGGEQGTKRAKAIGEAEYPMYHECSPGMLGNLLARSVLTGEPYAIHGAVVVGSNPVLSYPNASKVTEALGKLDLLVVFDVVMTETARLADIVLPACYFLERSELNVRGAEPIYCPAVVPAPFEARSSFDFIKGLFGAAGFNNNFPWRSVDEAIAFRLGPSGITLEQLKAQPEGLFSHQPGFKKYMQNGFATPSGKVEFYSQKMADLGYDPLPAFDEPSESYVNPPDGKGSYPYMLTISARVIEYYHSTLRGIPSLQAKEPEPVVEIHTSLARELGLNSGDMLSLETKRGRIQARAAVNEVTHPRILQMVEGWDEANVNVLTDDEFLDPVSGFPPLRSMLCRVSRVETAKQTAGAGARR